MKTKKQIIQKKKENQGIKDPQGGVIKINFLLLKQKAMLHYFSKRGEKRKNVRSFHH